MARKSRRNRSEAHGPRPQPARAPAATYTREQLAGLFGRKTAGENWEIIKQQHRGDPPARLCWQQLADKREMVRCEG